MLRRSTYTHVPLGPLQRPNHAFDDLVDLAHALELLAQGCLARLFRVEAHPPSSLSTRPLRTARGGGGWL